MDGRNTSSKVHRILLLLGVTLLTLLFISWPDIRAAALHILGGAAVVHRVIYRS